MRQENRTLFNFNTNTESLIRMYPSRAFIWRLLLSISPDRFGFLSLLVSVQFTPVRLGSQRVSKLKHSPWHSQCDKIRHKKIYHPSNFQPTGRQNLVPVTRSVKTRLWQCSQFTTLYFRRGCNHDVACRDTFVTTRSHTIECLCRTSRCVNYCPSAPLPMRSTFGTQKNNNNKIKNRLFFLPKVRAIEKWSSGQNKTPENSWTLYHQYSHAATAVIFRTVLWLRACPSLNCSCANTVPNFGLTARQVKSTASSF